MDIRPMLAIVGGVAHLLLVHGDGEAGPIRQFLIDLLCGALQKECPTPFFLTLLVKFSHPVYFNCLYITILCLCHPKVVIFVFLVTGRRIRW